MVAAVMKVGTVDRSLIDGMTDDSGSFIPRTVKVTGSKCEAVLFQEENGFTQKPTLGAL